MHPWLRGGTAMRLLLTGILGIAQRWRLRRARARMKTWQRQMEHEAHRMRESVYQRVLEEALGLAEPPARRLPIADSYDRLARRLVNLARITAYLKEREGDDDDFAHWLIHQAKVAPRDLDRLLNDTARMLRRLPARLYHVIERAADWVQVHLVGLTRTLLGQGRIVRAVPFPARAGRHPPGALIAAGPHVTRGPTQRGLVPVLSSVRG
ncbi:hypothetical protein [Nonomuraea typhae]|uniref:hypothetical protein n=1 Tax=Nonomuraea typhae TaxID=2603600 RepID=UPI0012FB0364|nr:hypothetical protein [Nonomuraea typhae]